MVKLAIAEGFSQLLTSHLTAHNSAQFSRLLFLFYFIFPTYFFVYYVTSEIWIFLYGVTQGLDARRKKATTNCLLSFFLTKKKTTDADNNSFYQCNLRRSIAFYYYYFLLWMPFYITISVNFILNNFIIFVMFYSCELCIFFSGSIVFVNKRKRKL